MRSHCTAGSPVRNVVLARDESGALDCSLRAGLRSASRASCPSGQAVAPLVGMDAIFGAEVSPLAHRYGMLVIMVRAFFRAFLIQRKSCFGK